MQSNFSDRLNFTPLLAFPSFSYCCSTNFDHTGVETCPSLHISPTSAQCHMQTLTSQPQQNSCRNLPRHLKCPTNLWTVSGGAEVRSVGVVAMSLPASLEQHLILKNTLVRIERRYPFDTRWLWVGTMVSSIRDPVTSCKDIKLPPSNSSVRWESGGSYHSSLQRTAGFFSP